MADQEDENIAGLVGAEGGGSSSDELEYELVVEEESIDTVWESSEVHPKQERPRIAFSRTEHPPPPEASPRIYLTNRPTSASPKKRPRSVQTDELPEELLEQDEPQREPDEQAAAVTKEQQEKSPLKKRISERLQRMRLRSASSRGDSPSKQK